MDIKRAKITTAQNPLASYQRWINLLAQTIRKTPVGKTPKVNFDPFTGSVFERELAANLAVSDKGADVVKALRYCFETLAASTLEKVINGLTQLGFEEIDASIGATIAPLSKDQQKSGYMNLVYRPKGDQVYFQLGDGYMHYGITGNDLVDKGVEYCAEAAEQRKFKIVAKDPKDQSIVDGLCGLVESIGKQAGLYVVVGATGGGNYPTLQTIRDIPTPGGIVLRKLSLTFESSFAELVSIVPVETPVLPFIKKD